ncbi:MAG TPA: TfoX/Sxy family protein [Nitrospirales bacterium]|nr:TfoX/Sxy family protein [Nitrospirales bacterium]
MSEYVEFLKEVFEEFGPIHPRRMFGGYGLFHKGLMFGLVADDVLYLKADETLSPFFEERELEPFQYKKHGKTFTMSYYMAPEEIFEDTAEAKGWALRSYEAAVRAKKPVKKVKQKKSRSRFNL